jgi:NAD(P) transhydrogenase subunit alpha
MAHIAVTRERRAGETRVALTPDAVKKLVAGAASVIIESGAGAAASYADADYVSVGARVEADLGAVLGGADILLKVRGPSDDEIGHLKAGAIVVGLLNPHLERAELDVLAARGVDAYAMEFVPRITRAQVMDALSSQANLAGYRAVIEAAEVYGRAMPMMMTAAGTIESLGAKFIAVEDEEFKSAETAAGYAKPMSAEYQAKQATLVSDHIRKQDIVITTALIPGRAAPRLVTAEQVASMKAGSVLIDLAVDQGGNVEGAQPDQVVEIGGVKIVGIGNLAGRIPADASALYARNLSAFLGLLLDKDGVVAPDPEDEILKAALVTHGGVVVHPALKAA